MRNQSCGIVMNSAKRPVRGRCNLKVMVVPSIQNLGWLMRRGGPRGQALLGRLGILVFRRNNIVTASKKRKNIEKEWVVLLPQQLNNM